MSRVLQNLDSRQRRMRVISGVLMLIGLAGLATEFVARNVFSRSLAARLMPPVTFEHIDLAGAAASGTVLGAGGRTRPDRPQRCLDRGRGPHPHLPDRSLSPRQQKEHCGTHRVFSIVDTP